MCVTWDLEAPTSALGKYPERSSGMEGVAADHNAAQRSSANLNACARPLRPRPRRRRPAAPSRGPAAVTAHPWAHRRAPHHGRWSTLILSRHSIAALLLACELLWRRLGRAVKPPANVRYRWKPTLLSVPGNVAGSRLEPTDRRRANGRNREGFRMPAWREQWTRYRGRRPKAADERTRGRAASSWPSMGIWSRSGVGRGRFCGDWRDLKAANDCGPELASAVEGLIGD
jgi:hypothetical protein